MATIEEIKKRIAVANGESARLNNQRQVSIGRRDTLNEQLSSMLKKYEEVYGVKLDKDNIDSEVQRVTAEKEQEVAKIEQILNLIKEGKYAEAENIVNPATPTESQVQVVAESLNSASDAQHVSQEVVSGATDDASQSTQSVVPPVAPSVSPVAPSVPPVAPSVPPVAPSVSPVAPSVPPVAAPSAPVVPPTPPVSAPVNDTGISALDGFSAPVGAPNTAPTMPSTPEAPSTPPTSFSAILGGTAFNPASN